MASDEQVRELAYQIWEEEGRPEGRDMEHYFRASRMLEERAAQAVAPTAGLKTQEQAAKPLSSLPVTQQGRAYQAPRPSWAKR